VKSTKKVKTDTMFFVKSTGKYRMIVENIKSVKSFKITGIGL